MSAPRPDRLPDPCVSVQRISSVDGDIERGESPDEIATPVIVVVYAPLVAFSLHEGDGADRELVGENTVELRGRCPRHAEPGGDGEDAQCDGHHVELAEGCAPRER